jgi:hypothetical protein
MLYSLSSESCLKIPQAGKQKTLPLKLKIRLKRKIALKQGHKTW